MTTNTARHAERELDILDALYHDPENPPIIKEFRNEILAICEKFGMSGQSGGSAPITARTLSKSIEKLCLQESIAPLTGEKDEWFKPMDDEDFYQNKRESAVFKNGAIGEAYYLDAVIFCGQDEWDQFTGKVEDITSRQFIKSFPFTPKKFFIDVIREEYNPEKHGKNARIIECDSGNYVYSIKDRSQLVPVFEYYDQYKK